MSLYRRSRKTKVVHFHLSPDAKKDLTDTVRALYGEDAPIAPVLRLLIERWVNEHHEELMAYRSECRPVLDDWLSAAKPQRANEEPKPDLTLH